MRDYGVGTLRRLHEVEVERDRYKTALEQIVKNYPLDYNVNKIPAVLIARKALEN